MLLYDVLLDRASWARATAHYGGEAHMALKFKAFALTNDEAHKTQRSLGDELEHRVNEWLDGKRVRLVDVRMNATACQYDPRTDSIGVLGMVTLTVFYEEE